jgi:hypothetical protein
LYRHDQEIDQTLKAKNAALLLSLKHKSPWLSHFRWNGVVVVVVIFTTMKTNSEG